MEINRASLPQAPPATRPSSTAVRDVGGAPERPGFAGERERAALAERVIQGELVDEPIADGYEDYGALIREARLRAAREERTGAPANHTPATPQSRRALDAYLANRRADTETGWQSTIDAFV